MALDRQVDLAMDAMQAQHDMLMGHMANIQASVLGLPVAAPSDESPKPGEFRGRPQPKDIDEPMPKPITPTGEGIHSDVGGVGKVALSDAPAEGEPGSVTYGIGPKGEGHVTPVLKLEDALKANKALREHLNTDTYIKGRQGELIPIDDDVIKMAGDIKMMPGAAYPWQVRRTLEETAKLKTHQTLSRALGGGGAKVLPITTTEEKE